MKEMKKILIVVMAALAFVACSNDDVLPDGTDGKDGNGNEIEGDAYISLKLRTVSSTRAVVNPNAQEYGTAEESKITDAIALFFDAEKNLTVTRYLDFTNSEIGTPGQPTGLSGAAFKIPSTSKYLLVVANPSDEFSSRDFASLLTYDNINAAICLDQDSNSATVDQVTKKKGTDTRNYFMMTNAKGDLEPSDSYGNLEALLLYPTSIAAEAIPTVINLDRVVAKVQVRWNYQINSTTDFDLINLRWLLNVTNKKYYPASEREKTHLNTWVWSDQYGKGTYRRDPNFDNSFTQWIPGNTPENQSNYNNNYNYIYEENTPDLELWNEVNSQVSDYCLENTQEQKDNTHAYTTQVLLRVQMAPKKFFFESDNTIYEYQRINNEWFIVSNNYYNWESMVRSMEAQLWNRKIRGDDTPLVDAFNRYLENIGQEPLPKDIEGERPTLNNIVEHKFTVAMEAVRAHGSGSFGNVTYYKDGINYYKIMIKHDNKDSGSTINEFGEYGVVRNSIYDILINRINYPGYPVIPLPDPNTPNEEDDKEQWISVQINVNPWTLYRQEEDL